MTTDCKPTKLTPEDNKELARLVGKYGRNFIVEAARRVGVRRAGRPKRLWDREDRESIREWHRLDHAEWIEERAAEYKAAGRGRDAYKLATSDLFRRVVDGQEQRREGAFAKFQKKMKKARAELRRLDAEVQRVKEFHALTPPYLGWCKATP